jgi:hypothetical protein
LPVHTLPGAVDAVLALDNPRMLAGACTLLEFTAGDRFEVGPFQVTWALPHFVPNAGMRLTTDGQVLAYTGNTDVLLAEATFAEHVLPEKGAPYLSTSRQTGEHAAKAGAGRLCSPTYGRARTDPPPTTPPGRLTPPISISTSPPQA